MFQIEYPHPKTLIGDWCCRLTLARTLQSSVLHIGEIFVSRFRNSFVPGTHEKQRSAWYTLFVHAFNLPKMWGLRYSTLCVLKRLLMFQIVTIETGGLFNLAVDLMQLFSENTTYVGCMDHAMVIWITSYTSLILNPDPPLHPSRKKGEGVGSRLTPPFLSPSTFHPYTSFPALPPSFLSPPLLVTFLPCWMLLDSSFKSETIMLTSSLKRYDLLPESWFGAKLPNLKPANIFSYIINDVMITSYLAAVYGEQEFL